MARNTDIIAVLPAAGKASRLGSLPCSKEILPLRPGRPGSYRPAPGSRVVIEDALHMLGRNGISEAIIVTAPGKEDIRDYLGDGPVGGVAIRFLTRANSPSVPHTLQTAIATLYKEQVLVWFPDILVTPDDVVAELAAGHRKTGADITLALVPSDRGDKVDIVSADESGKILAISPKPGAGISGWTWVAALWSPRFSEFLDAFVSSPDSTTGRENHVGDVINAACQSDFIVHSVNFPDGEALDIGTPEDLARLWL